MDCGVCFEKYDTANREPFVLLCGHSLCKSCVRILPENNCPQCRQPFADGSPRQNFALLDVLRSFAADGIPAAGAPNRNPAEEEPPAARGVKRCRCGSTDHFRTNHSSCRLNRKNSVPAAGEARAEESAVEVVAALRAQRLDANAVVDALRAHRTNADVHIAVFMTQGGTGR